MDEDLVKSFSTKMDIYFTEPINKNNVATNNFLIKRKNQESNSELEFFLEVLIPMKEIYCSNDRNEWFSSHYSYKKINDYILLYKSYSKNASTNRAHSSIIYGYSDEYNERKRFSKSNVCVLKKKNDSNCLKIIGGSWLEGAEKTYFLDENIFNYDQQMHIFIDNEFEGMGLGKVIEWASINFCPKPHTQTISCGWHPNYNRPKKFFESLNYEFRHGFAFKRIK